MRHRNHMTFHLIHTVHHRSADRLIRSVHHRNRMAHHLSVDHLIRSVLRHNLTFHQHHHLHTDHRRSQRQFDLTFPQELLTYHHPTRTEFLINQRRNLKPSLNQESQQT